MDLAQCGLSAQESHTKLQTELATLFSRNLHIANSASEEATATKDLSFQTANPVTYSITQHYHHSAHVVPLKSSSQTSDTGSDSLRSSSSRESVQYTLFQHNIDPSRLSSSQLALLEQAGLEERARLLGLWRLSPPDTSYFGLQEHAHDYDEERQIHEDCRGDSITRSSAEPRQVAEPYMTSGYESLAQRDYNEQANLVYSPVGLAKMYSPLVSPMGGQYNRATDPIYGSKEWWHHSIAQEPMEHQYGMFDQMNQSEHQPPNFVGIHGPEDEEML